LGDWGIKIGFWMKKGFENRRFWSVQMMLHLSEGTRHLSELPCSCLELEIDRSLKRAPSEQFPNFRHLSSLKQAPSEQEPDFRRLCSLKRTFRRLSERRCFVPRFLKTSLRSSEP